MGRKHHHEDHLHARTVRPVEGYSGFRGGATTLRVCIMNENVAIRRAFAHQYTTYDIDQTAVLHERSEPA